MKTAIDWLVEQVNQDCLNSAFIRPEFIKKAKAMEREQIEKAYNVGTSVDGYHYNCPLGDTYYKQTYGGDK